MKKKQTDLIIPDEVLINKIYYLRKQKVMLDRDLAELYGVPARRLREQVKRNHDNFPTNFMFQLTEAEIETLLAHKAIPSRRNLGGNMPYVFTEHGVLMLANVLRSEQAIKVSIKIIEIFVRLREMLADNTMLRKAIESLEKKTDNNTKNIELVFQYIDRLLEEKNNPTERASVGYKLSKK
ncbi:ORF6N domain-containing protein [Pedobacter sp. KR3-3]|uniref:ORF6N domain-containing protein n=1 Tax=Pedobacter albus TaxID=3113905 RepID=A0ABU7I8L4_9SPHI|nr:ORF6N domain-containing protein [Pedobacter sp. KR3-3]MEE1945711.1 ORF6N domain-containing protein [Pedobacter sp. KR3-3]